MYVRGDRDREVDGHEHGQLRPARDVLQERVLVLHLELDDEGPAVFGLALRLRHLHPRFGVRISGIEIRIWGIAFRISGIGFRTSGMGFRVSSTRFRVYETHRLCSRTGYIIERNRLWRGVAREQRGCRGLWPCPAASSPAPVFRDSNLLLLLDYSRA